MEGPEAGEADAGADRRHRQLQIRRPLPTDIQQYLRLYETSTAGQVPLLLLCLCHPALGEISHRPDPAALFSGAV